METQEQTDFLQGQEQSLTESTKSRYINPKTDFAFKHFFGKEPHKDLLISFLNGVFKGRKVVIDLEYRNLELKGKHEGERKTSFDLFCTGDKGEKFIVEMQQAKREFFKDRMVFYASNVIYQQGTSVPSNWNYELPEVYLIALMDFAFDNTRLDQYEHDVRLMEINSQTQFYEKLGYIFIEMPKFKKDENQLESAEDFWLYSLRHMSNLTEIPLSLKNKEEFVKLYKIAEVSNLNPDEMSAYEASLKIARDNYSHDETIRNEARREGLEKGKREGLEEGKREGLKEGKLEGRRDQNLETARKLKSLGISLDIISQGTGLSVEEIEEL